MVFLRWLLKRSQGWAVAGLAIAALGFDLRVGTVCEGFDHAGNTLHVRQILVHLGPFPHFKGSSPRMPGPIPLLLLNMLFLGLLCNFECLVNSDSAKPIYIRAEGF